MQTRILRELAGDAGRRFNSPAESYPLPPYLGGPRFRIFCQAGDFERTGLCSEADADLMSSWDLGSPNTILALYSNHLYRFPALRPVR